MRQGLKKALAVLRDIERQAGSDRVLANMALAARFIAAGALLREESRGAQARSDYPESSSALCRADLPHPRGRRRSWCTHTGQLGDWMAMAGRSRPMSGAAPELRLPSSVVDKAVAQALAEDLGLGGDITTEATIPVGTRASGVIAARQAGTIAGVQLAEAAFKTLDPFTQFEVLVGDGSRVEVERRHRARLRRRARAADG